ncbi:MAG: serine protease [Nitriliruptorales bacterium]|nr:serine protease [Nitriliruptorales bacterium]
MEPTVPAGYRDLAETQARNQAHLLDKDHVVGVACGTKIAGGEDTGEQALTVLVDTKLPREMLTEDDLVDTSVDDTPTDVQEVGVLQAGQAVPVPPEVMEPSALSQRVRPAMGGFSCGHPQVTAGTIATGCYDASPFPGIPQRYYLLSNNHVIANSNNAQIGDPCLQPGRVDGGQDPQDVIGRLARFVPIQFMSGASAPLNLVDAAIAEVPFHLLSREIYYLGYVKRLFIAPNINDVVQKTGRTTNFTTGRVTNINATVDVNYDGRVARFARQTITTAMSAGGDSGSLVTNLDEEGVGLLFAGSSEVTILNNLAFVQSLLGVRITEK